jgi:diguanylate cyclase (GGDEF)-like protein
MTTWGVKPTNSNPPASGHGQTDEAAAALGFYRTAILAFGANAERDGSPHGTEIRKQLERLSKLLGARLTPDCVKETIAKVTFFLDQWGAAIAKDSRAQADETRQLLILLATTAQTVGSSDQAYATRFTALSENLEQVAAIDDLTQLRAAVVQHLTELKTVANQMAEKSQKVVTDLEAKAAAYESIAFKDQLTSLPNRRCIQQQIGANVESNSPFSVVVFDLDRFKPINDEYGHLVGDELLKLFSAELHKHTRTGDIAARWGGDEFISILTCGEDGARSYVQRIKKSVFGKYTIHPSGREVEVLVQASFGIAQWAPPEDIDAVIARADANMYANKRQFHLAST